MSDDEGDEGAPASTGIPIVTDSEGRAYIPAEAAVALLRALADACRNLAEDANYDLDAVAVAIDMEADGLDCRAIERTA